MAIYNNDIDPNVTDWENSNLEDTNKEYVTSLEDYIKALKDQIATYKRLSEVNDNIIKSKDEWIAILEGKIALLTSSK